MDLFYELVMALDGGKGSGNFAHKGRPGEIGGSGKGGGLKGFLDNIVFDEEESKYHSISKHIDSEGKISNKRRKLHNKIMKEMFDGVKTTSSPTIYFNGGGSASGKSSAARSGLFGDIPTLQNKEGIYIDSDEIKKKIPEYISMVENGEQGASAYVHEESSTIAKFVKYRAIKSGQYDVVMDGTLGGNTNQVKENIENARKSGAKVVGNFTTADIDKALDRNYLRFLKTGRKPNEKELLRNHKQFSRNLPEIANMFDSCVLVDTNGKEPRKILEVKDGEMIIYDKMAYDKFLDKVNADDDKLLRDFESRKKALYEEYILNKMKK